MTDARKCLFYVEKFAKVSKYRVVKFFAIEQQDKLSLCLYVVSSLKLPGSSLDLPTVGMRNNITNIPPLLLLHVRQ